LSSAIISAVNVTRFVPQQSVSSDNSVEGVRRISETS